MTQIDFKRIAHVSKYIVLNDRKWYIGMLLSASMMLVAYYLFFQAISKLLFAPDSYRGERIIYLAPFLIMTTAAMTIYITACTFHTMRTRRKRIAFLSLPANNAEKYIALIITMLATIVGMAVLATVTTFVLPSGDNFSDISIRASDIPVSIIANFEISIFALMFGIALLINSVKYKWNVVLTAGVQLVAGIVMIILFDISDTIRDDMLNFDSFAIVYTIINWIGLAVCFALSYIAFKRTQITNRLNA